MGSINPPKKKDYGKNTRIDVNQSYQLADWTDRFGISEEELIEAVRETGGLATNVEVYLSQKRIER
jgi:AraC-like DNA-binding protein